MNSRSKTASLCVGSESEVAALCRNEAHTQRFRLPRSPSISSADRGGRLKSGTCSSMISATHKERATKRMPASSLERSGISLRSIGKSSKLTNSDAIKFLEPGHEGSGRHDDERNRRLPPRHRP